MTKIFSATVTALARFPHHHALKYRKSLAITIATAVAKVVAVLWFHI